MNGTGRGGALRNARRQSRKVFAFVLAWLLLLVTAPVIDMQAAEAAVALPAGFSLQSIATGQPEGSLTNFEFLPGDGVMTLGRSGLITVVSGDAPPRTLLSIPDIRAVGDLGALGLTLAPDYATSGRLYTWYTHNTANGFRLRVSRWTADPPADPTTLTGEQVIVEAPLQVNYHGGGTVLVAPDGNLLVSTGDNAAPLASANPIALRAQNLDDPHGKILRINPDTGSGVPGNPFYSATSPSSWRSRVYAYGLRNPFRMSVDPRNGRVLIGDVGWTLYEEVNLLSAGANFGWPCYEGPAQQSSYKSMTACQQVYKQPVRAPLWSYASPTSQSSVVGGTWYTGTSYPAAYRGAYFYADYSLQKIWTVMLDAQERVTRSRESAGFASGIGGPVALKSGPNGDIFFADILSSRLMRLRYSAGNRAPVPQVTTIVNPATLTVRFDGTSSYDLDGDAITYEWDFGDGQRRAGAVTNHAYAAPGTYNAKLTVRDALGASATTTITVVPDNHAPELTLTGPDKKYAVGDPVSLSASARDVEDGDLPVSWRTDLVHCAPDGGCHLHPGLTSTGPTFATTIEDHGEDTRLQVTASAVDSKGVRVQRVYTAEPDLRTLTVVSTAPVLINGIQRVSVKVAVNSRNDVSAPATFANTVFTGWSDGGLPTHALTMPKGDRTLTAHYSRFVPGRYADYNGEGRTDLAVYRPDTGIWSDRLLFEIQYGGPTDVPVPADINSDGRTDIVIWRPANGVWYARGISEVQYGGRGDVPVPGDYNGDRRTDIAIWRPSTGTWHVRGVSAVKWGVQGDIPVPGDYNGDGKMDRAVWRPSTGTWWIQGRASVQWGERGDIPVQADFNGDKKTDLALWRPSTGTWLILGRPAQRWGVSGDVPLAGDFNGDGRADLAVWRPSTATWWVVGMTAVQWGRPGDQPLPRPPGSQS